MLPATDKYHILAHRRETELLTEQ